MKSVLLFLKTAAIFLLAGLLIIHTNDAKLSIQRGLQICADSVLPILFPFFVLSDLWIRCGAAAQAAAFTAPLMESVFHLPGSAASAFLLGSIGGYPVGARTTAQLYRDGAISKSAAEHTLLFCNNAGPSFIIGVVGYGVFQSASAGVLLYTIHLTSSIAIGILFRSKETEHATLDYKVRPEAFLSACKNAVYEGGKTAITVCIFILFFSVLTGCVTRILPVSPISSIILPGLLEITSGFHAIKMTFLPLRMVFAISAFLLGLGGCCVMLQAISFTESAGLSCKKMLIGKGLQGTISAAAAYMLWPVLPNANPCFRIETTSVSVSQFYLLLMICLPIILFLKKSSGKKEKSHI